MINHNKFKMIQIKDLTKKYGKNTIIENVNLNIESLLSGYKSNNFS